MTRTLLVYGDSNSHGTVPLTQLGQFDRYGRQDRWPQVMAHQLGPDWEVIAEGLPGRTTVHDDPVEGGARNGLAVLPAILHSHAPLDAVMILLGTNDLKQRFSVSAWEIARSVLRLAETVKGAGLCKRVAVMAPLPVLETGCLAPVFAGAQARQDGLTAHLGALAQAAGVQMFDCAAFGAVSPIDGVHWSAETQRAVGRGAAAFVRRVWE